MTVEDRPTKNVWVVMMILSLLFLLWTAPMLVLSGGGDVLEQGLKLAGSPLNTSEIEETAGGFFNMVKLKPVWEEVWIGVLGIYSAVGLRARKGHAWALGFFWGIM
jgi:hypothetical protein